MRSATGTLGTPPAALALQGLKLAPTVVTPNGDHRGDQLKIAYTLTAAATVNATVYDTLGDAVATIFNQRRPAGSSSFTWSKVALPDGRYRLVLTARDERGKQVQSTTSLWIDRTLARFASSTPAISPNRDGRLDSLTFSFQLLAAANVQVRILQGGAVVATPLASALPVGKQSLVWYGGGLPDGKYSAVVSATDSLMTIKQSLLVRIDRKAPVLRLVSFARRRFWLSEPARLVIGINGRWHRLTIKRAGFFRVGHRGTVRGLTATAVDSAGNRSRTVAARR
jgi:hypothetical protein